ncbi:MAG TPA: hypothetical protein VE153_14675 [Myxococcus sp.]|nr:hypothetical protein [Myxococcus sp.]
MTVNLRAFTALVRNGALMGPVNPEAPTVAAPLTGSPKTPSAPGVGPDTFEAASVKRESLSLPKLTVPDAPGTREWGSELVNEAAKAQAEKGWATKNKPIQQTTPSGCGEASLAFLSHASRINTSTPPAKKVNVNLADGTTPEEMGAVLGTRGLGVTGVTGGYPSDANAMSEALKEGKLGLALVDPEAIKPAHEQSQEPGLLHWVALDGFNSGPSKTDASDDLYRVTDPMKGKYWVSVKDLQRSIEQGKKTHGGGGVLFVERQKDDVDTQLLSEKNRNISASLGKPGGHGSRRSSVSESS